MCLECAGLGHLEYLPPGDPAFTRRARIASRQSVVVMGWSRRFRGLVRQGILVEPAAIERAAMDYLSAGDQPRKTSWRVAEDQKFRLEFAAAIREQFPGCPDDRAEAIALHAAMRTSGWRGQPYTDRSSDPEAVRLAVAASVRHLNTEYDALLAAGADRESAHAKVRDRVEDIMNAWRDGVALLDD